MKKLVLRNRFTLLGTVLLAYISVLVVEGLVTDRKSDLLIFDNSLFELNVKQLQEINDTLFDE